MDESAQETPGMLIDYRALPVVKFDARWHNDRNGGLCLVADDRILRIKGEGALVMASAA